MFKTFPIVLQSLLPTLCATFLTITWPKLISPIFQCIRRDRDIFGHNLIIISISFLGIFAFASDHLNLPSKPNDSAPLFTLVFLLFVLWLICVRLVKAILHAPVGQQSYQSIATSRFLINFFGLIAIFMCRFLLSQLFSF